MKRLLQFLLILFLTSPSLGAELPLEVEIDNFDGGVDTAHLSDKLRTSNLSDCMNFLSDRKFGLTRREGAGFGPRCLYTSTLKLWTFIGISGDEWLIRLDCRGNLIAGKSMGSSGSCFSVCLSTNLIDTTVDTDAVVALGKIWFTNRVNGQMSWDENNFVLYPNAPKAARITTYKNRIVLGDISNSQSAVALSGELNGSDYGYDSRYSTSPVIVYIGGVNDGNKVFGIHPGLDELLIFKAYSMWGLSGNDQRDFRIRTIFPNIGTIYPDTVDQRAERTLFLSNRGLESYTPPMTMDLVGNPIRDQLDILSGLTSNSRQYFLETQAQWDEGTKTPTENLSTTILEGGITTVNHTFVDTEQSDWRAGTTTIHPSTVAVLDVTDTPGFMVAYTTSMFTTTMSNYDFETQGVASTNSLHWNVEKSSECALAVCSNLTPWSRSIGSFGAGTYNMVAAAYNTNIVSSSIARGEIFLTNGSGDVVATAAIPVKDNNAQYVTRLALPNWLSYNSIPVTPNLHVELSNIEPDHVLPFSTTVQMDTSMVRLSTFVEITCMYSWNGSDRISLECSEWTIIPQRTFPSRSIQFQSRVFDTQVSTPNFDRFYSDAPISTVTLTIQTSTAPHCCWGNAIAITSGAIPSNLQSRYMVYNATFTITVPTATVILSSMTFGSWTTGYYQTKAIDVGQEITSWGLFTAGQSLSGGGITYQVQTSDDGTFTEGGWTSQTLDTNISNSVKRYIGARIYFDTAFSTIQPVVDNITFNWSNGETPPDPLAITYKDSYYLFFSTLTTTASGQTNDRTAVFNRNNTIDLYGGLYVGGASIYNNSLYLGDAQETGYIYSMFNSTDGTDFNNNVESFAKFKRFDGGKPDAEKTFDRMYMTISRENSDVSQIFGVTYSINASTTWYNASNVEISTGNNLAVLKSFFPIDAPRQGHYIDIKVSELTERTQPYSIHRIKLYGTIREVE